LLLLHLKCKFKAKKKTKSTFSKSVTWANSLTGNVSLSKGKLTALLGFNVTRSDTVTINVPFSFNGKYRQKVQYRKRYRKYKITRIEYLKIVGSSTQKKHLKAFAYNGLKSIFETGFKRHSEPRLPSTAQINH
jgi:D-serine dehydratase